MGFDFKATGSPDLKITERQEKRNIFKSQITIMLNISTWAIKFPYERCIFSPYTEVLFLMKQKNLQNIVCR